MVGVVVFLLSYVLTSRAMKALLATVSISRQLLSRDLPCLPLLTPWVWLVGGAVVARPPLEQVDWDRVTWRHVRTE